jgi:transposase
MKCFQVISAAVGTSLTNAPPSAVFSQINGFIGKERCRVKEKGDGTHGNFVPPGNSRQQAICHFLNACKISRLREEHIYPDDGPGLIPNELTISGLL